MVFDEDQDERRREKFSRERGGQQDFRRSFERPKRMGDYTANGSGGLKRSFRGGDEEQANNKRGRFEAASDGYEPIFNRRGPESNMAGTTLLTFKKFLVTQDESLSDEEAIAKYNEYKTDFMRQECERYFQAHKEEEWFRFKYHPEEGRSWREEHLSNIQKRLTVFNEFLDEGRFKGISLNTKNAEPIIRLMDAAVIKLEGGSDADIESIKNEPIDDESVQDQKQIISSSTLTGDVTSSKDDEMIETAVDSNSENNAKRSGSAGKTQEDPNYVKKSDEEAADETSMETEPSVISNKRTDSEQSHQPKAPQLHKTCSIHFRSVPANAPLEDLENLCKQHPGFLRLAIIDPILDFRGNSVRSAWATYRHDVNIKEIFWALRGAKLMSCELGAVVNRDLRRRVRVYGEFTAHSEPSFNLLDSHRPVAANALRQAARLIVLLDAREGLYREEMEAEEGEEDGGVSGTGQSDEASKLIDDLDGAVIRSRNPILTGIADYMVEESSAEEETLLERAAAASALTGEEKTLEITQQFEEDLGLIHVLDRLLLYLRLVHSLDFYGTVKYSQEDQMPNRLGLVHVRASPSDNAPKTKAALQLTKRAVDSHIGTFNARLNAGLFKKYAPLSEQELQKMQKKDAEKAVEEFINANTQQLGPDKWLCPLSGKKFKGPEFVQKHISTKYKDDVDKVRYEALYFNNFISDPDRPHNPQLYATVASENKSSRDIRLTTGSEPHAVTSARDRGDFGSDMPERMPYQRNSWGGGGFGNEQRDRYYGGQTRYGGGRPPLGGSTGWRGPPGRTEPMNETAMRAIPSVGARDPRAPPSYRDLDAPTDDII